MKKLISVILAVIMVMSCFSVFPAIAAEEDDIIDNLLSNESIESFTNKLKVMKVNGLPGKIEYDIDEFKKTGDWDKVDLFGITLDFLYCYDESPLNWTALDVYLKENGEYVRDENGNRIMYFTKDTFALSYAHISKYFKNMFYNNYGGLNFFNVENAVMLINIIGNLFYPDFVEYRVEQMQDMFGNKRPSAMEFFDAVTDISEFDTLLQQNWCNKKPETLKPVIQALGGNYVDIYTNEYSDGLKIGAKLLEGMHAKLVAVGPFQYIFDLLDVFVLGYENSLKDVILDLFTLRLNAIYGKEYVEKFNTFDGLLHLLFCNCDPNASSGTCYTDGIADHFSFLKFPASRYLSAADVNEKALYLFYYLNLCGVYKTNSNAISKMETAILSNTTLDATEKDRTIALIEGLLCNQFEVTVEKVIKPFYKENFDTNVNKENLFTRIKNMLTVMFKKIADYIEYWRQIFSGDRNFGDSVLK